MSVKIVCEICDYSTERKDTYKRHIESKGHKIKAGELLKEKKVLNCEKCEYKTTRTDNMKRHIEAHHIIIKYHCEYCKLTIKGEENIISHKNREMHRLNVILAISKNRGKIYNLKSQFKIMSLISNTKLTENDYLSKFNDNDKAEYIKISEELKKHLIELRSLTNPSEMQIPTAPIKCPPKKPKNNEKIKTLEEYNLEDLCKIKIDADDNIINQVVKYEDIDTLIKELIVHDKADKYPDYFDFETYETDYNNDDLVTYTKLKFINLMARTIDCYESE